MKVVKPQKVIIQCFRNELRRAVAVETSSDLVFVTTETNLKLMESGDPHSPPLGFPREHVFQDDGTLSLDRLDASKLKRWDD